MLNYSDTKINTVLNANHAVNTCCGCAAQSSADAEKLLSLVAGTLTVLMDRPVETNFLAQILIMLNEVIPTTQQFPLFTARLLNDLLAICPSPHIIKKVFHWFHFLTACWNIV